MSCITGCDPETKQLTQTRFSWNLNQVESFLNYLDTHNISAC